MLIAVVTTVVVLLVVVSIAEVRKLRRKPTEELMALLYTDQWARYGAALKELRRRGEDLTAFEERVRDLLVSDHLVDRANAYNLLTDFYPATKAQLAGYRSTDAPDVARRKFPHHFPATTPSGRTCVSSDRRPIELELTSPFLVMADPAALEGLRGLTLPAVPPAGREQIVAAFAAAPVGFDVRVHEVPDFRPGTYRITFSDIVATTDESRGHHASVDTGALVFFDYARHAAVLEHLNREAYDLALQDATSDRFEAITARIGSRSYAIMFGDADAKGDFKGDGAYRLAPAAPSPVPALARAASP